MDGCAPPAMGLEDRACREALTKVVPSTLAHLLVKASVGEDTIATSDLLDRTMLESLLNDDTVDRRAVVSVWALEAFETVLPTVVAAAVLLGRVPEAETGWIITTGRVTGLRVVAWNFGSFAEFVTAVLGPFVAIVAARGGVSPRVLWSNAGHIVEASLGMLERDAGVSAGTAALRDLLAAPVVGGGASGLFMPVRYVDGKRVRRVCCLRFLVPSWRICLICPLPAGNAGRTRTSLSPCPRESEGV